VNESIDVFSPDRVRQVLQGYPDGLVTAAVAFVTKRDAPSLDRLMIAVVTHHLPGAPEERPDLTTLPGTTQLVADLQLDSLSLVEINYLLQEMLDVRLGDAELTELKSIDDLRRMLRRHLGVTPPG
jgi:acyl carrier protein